MSQPMQRPDVAVRSRVPLIVLFLSLLVTVGVVAAAVYIFEIRRPANQSRAFNEQVTLQMVGLAAPVTNSLDARFVDSNNDLVADAPRDPKNIIDPDVLTFSFTASENPAAYRDAFKPFTEFLGQVTGKKTEYLPFNSADDEARALRDGKLQVAGLNTGNVPMAVDFSGFVPICMIANEDGSHFLQMEIIVRAGSAIQQPKDLRGHELVLTDASSNAGFKAPLVLLRQKYGLEPGRDYATRYSGGYEQSIHGVASGEYEAAAIANDKLRRLVAAGEIRPEQYRSIYKSPNFPTATFGYSCLLKPDLAAKVKSAFEKFDWKGTAMAKEFGEQAKFVPVNYKTDFAVIREIDNSIGTHHVLAEAATTQASR